MTGTPDRWRKWKRDGTVNGKPVRAAASWYNSRYHVRVYDVTSFKGMLHMQIGRLDERPVSWREKQRIKNEIVGEHRLAIEVFPPEADLVDNLNRYHLWVFPEGYRLNFGLLVPGAWSRTSKSRE